MKYRLLVITAAMLITGCVSMGPNYNPAIIDHIQVGASKAAVIAQLGRPTTTTTMQGGQQQLMWVHSRGTMLGKAQARSATLLFDASGRYVGVANQAETNLR